MNHTLQSLLMLWLVLLTVVASGCALDNPATPPPPLDYETFVCQVQPVLARECSFPACHGSVHRRYQVLAPGRMRLADQYPAARALLSPEAMESGEHPVLTEAELRFNFVRTRAFAVSETRDSQLLTRPLVGSEGGVLHGAGADVFPSDQDAGYRAIQTWLEGATGCP